MRLPATVFRVDAKIVVLYRLKNRRKKVTSPTVQKIVDLINNIGSSCTFPCDVTFPHILAIKAQIH